jgi:hypothetical protein
LTGNGSELVFNFYYKGDLPLYHPFNLLPLTHPDYKKGRPGPAEVPAIMENITAKQQRLWYVPYGVAIDTTLEQWLAEHSYPAWHSWLGSKRLALYDLTMPTPRREVLDFPFSNEAGTTLRLIEATLPQTTIAAGDTLPLTLAWQTETAIPRDYHLSLRLSNAQGDIFAQSDWPPLTPNQPPPTWSPGQLITDRRSLWLPTDVPPGEYALQLVVYAPRPDSGAALGQPALIPHINVGPAQISPPLTALALPNALKQSLGDLVLVGYAAPPSLQPGQEMWLWLYWQAQSQVAPETVIRLTLQSDVWPDWQ